MKRTLTLSILLLNLFVCIAQNERDPYWEFDEAKHFRPELNKGDFYKLSGFDFGWFVLEPISKFVKKKEYEIERNKSLSYGQKALYYWWYLDAQVTNGGFDQFYGNGYGPYASTIIKGLEHIGDTAMAALVKKADNIYQRSQKLMDKAQESSLSSSDFYAGLDALSLLDTKYYEMNDKTMSIIEAYIRKNPNEICVDENGKEFDLAFTGLCKTFYSDNTVQNEFPLEQGVINGEFKSYYENGILKEKIDYKNGKETGEREEYFDNGTLKYKVVKDESNDIVTYNYFYENGVQKKLVTKKGSTDTRLGVTKEWYDNTQLKEQSVYVGKYTRAGKWVKFWKDGSKKLEANFEDGKAFYQNYWTEKGEQILIDGTGLYINEYEWLNKMRREETGYKNYLKHGKSRSFTEGLLRSEEEYKDGKRHGASRSYYKNGNLKQESVYENGKEISFKYFRKFKNPKVKTNIISRICKGCYDIHEGYLLPDNQPLPINGQELTQRFKAETSIIEAYDDDKVLSYGYYLFIDEKGNVENIDFAVGDNMWIHEELQSSMSELKFEPALKDGEPIKSIHYVRYQLRLAE